MVSVSGPSSQNQILQTLSRVDRKEASAQEVVSPQQGDDTVSISQEAQEISRAQSAASDISAELQQNDSLSLLPDDLGLNDLI